MPQKYEKVKMTQKDCKYKPCFGRLCLFHFSNSTIAWTFFSVFHHCVCMLVNLENQNFWHRKFKQWLNSKKVTLVGTIGFVENELMIGSLQQFTKKNSYKGQFLCCSVHFIKLVRQSKNVFNAMLIQNIIKQKNKYKIT